MANREAEYKLNVTHLVNKASLVHNFFLVCLSLFSTCFGRLCAHRQEK